MLNRILLSSCLGVSLLTFAGLAKADFISTVDSTNPLAYFRLETANGSSQVGGYTTTYQNGASVASPGIATGEPSNNYVNLNNASQQYVSTSLSGGVNTAGSIMAWVNLAELPSVAGTTFYVAGESQYGNDFDLQFQNDNKLYFYSAGGSSVSYTPNTNNLLGQWNMIVATFNATTNTQDIYWDGQLVSSGSVGSGTNKQGAFWIGESSVFGGRYLDGGIDEVGVWNYDLSASQVTELYDSAGSAPSSPSGVPEPSTNLLLGGGLLALIAVVMRHRRVSADWPGRSIYRHTAFVLCVLRRRARRLAHI